MSKKYPWQFYILIFCTSCVLILGLLMVFNASSADAIEQNLIHKTHHALIRQIYSLIISFIICFVVWAIGYKEMVKMSPLLYTLLIISLLLVFVPGIGRCINGARRWIVIGSFVAQPSEFVKLFVPLIFIEKIAFRGESFQACWKKYLFICAPLLLVLLQPSNGVCATLVATLIVLLFLNKVSYKWLLWPIIIFCAFGVFAATKVPYVKARIENYIHPERDILGKGHQPFQAKIAAGSGGVWGKGLAKSLQKHRYLPEAQNDYVAAIFAEEFGFMGILCLVLLYMCLGFCGFSIALRAKDSKGAMLASAISFSVSLQAFLNLAVVSGLAPSTGLNLPLFSQGGSSLLANLMSLTLLLNICTKSVGEEVLCPKESC